MSRLFFFCLFVLSTGYSLPLLYTSGSSKITFFRTDPATALSTYNKEKLGKRAQMHTSGERAFSGQAVTSSAQYPHLKTEAIIFCLSQIMLLWYFIFHSSEYLIYARLSALPAVLKIKKIFKVINFPDYYGFCFMSCYRIQLQSLVQQMSSCKLCL